MDLFTAMKISSSGMSLQRSRMNVISSNLANINTTRTPEGGPYRRKMV
ncbi:Flagellar basal-body rod protein FlgC, partial [hydrothermal vent metagenome]